MIDPGNKSDDSVAKPCSCVQDPYADLPPELQPRQKDWKSSFKKVKCRGCGLEFYTNVDVEFCMDCRSKASTDKE